MIGLWASLRVTVEVALAVASRHPIHSSAAVITLSPGSAIASIVLRAFADDFPPGTSPGAIERYLAGRFQLTDQEGKPVPLQVDSVRVDGLVVVTTLTASTPRGLSGYRIWHGVLSERFTDQVNMLQARYGGRSVSLLFTASDSAKPLP
jgi:uncharacterized protein DUF6702